MQRNDFILMDIELKEKEEHKIMEGIGEAKRRLRKKRMEIQKLRQQAIYGKKRGVKNGNKNIRKGKHKADSM